MKTNKKTVVINGKPIHFEFNMRTWFIYCKAFGTSPENDLGSIDYSTDKGQMLANLKIHPQIIWALAKTAEPTIPSIKKWTKAVGPFNCVDVCSELEGIFPEVGVKNNV